ncbi:MAG: hypothetical protein ACLTS6_17355 [Anaerobutyricum sp.]
MEEKVSFEEVTEHCLSGQDSDFHCDDRRILFLQKQEEKEEYWILSPEELKIIFEKLSQYSVFAYKEEIGEGYITLKGGHRAGLCGKYYYDGIEKPQIKNISSINLRVAREVKNCALPIVPWLFEGEEFCHTLLVSAPGCVENKRIYEI